MPGLRTSRPAILVQRGAANFGCDPSLLRPSHYADSFLLFVRWFDPLFVARLNKRCTYTPGRWMLSGSKAACRHDLFDLDHADLAAHGRRVG